jgi:hypothetical protein
MRLAAEETLLWDRVVWSRYFGNAAGSAGPPVQFDTAIPWIRIYGWGWYLGLSADPSVAAQQEKEIAKTWS